MRCWKYNCRHAIKESGGGVPYGVRVLESEYPQRRLWIIYSRRRAVPGSGLTWHTQTSAPRTEPLARRRVHTARSRRGAARRARPGRRRGSPAWPWALRSQSTVVYRYLRRGPRSGLYNCVSKESEKWKCHRSIRSYLKHHQNFIQVARKSYHAQYVGATKAF